MATRPLAVIDALYRRRWLIMGALVAVFLVVLQVNERQRDWVSWIAVALLALLVWVPTAGHWLKIAGESRRAFRAGLDGA